MVIWYEPLLLADIVHIRSFFTELISHIKCIFYCFLELTSSNQSNVLPMRSFLLLSSVYEVC